jgi:hypothetical protein
MRDVGVRTEFVDSDAPERKKGRSEERPNLFA